VFFVISRSRLNKPVASDAYSRVKEELSKSSLHCLTASINLFKGLETVPPLETFPGLPIVRIFVRMFLIPGGHRGDRCRFLFLFVQDKPAGALSFL